MNLIIRSLLWTILLCAPRAFACADSMLPQEHQGRELEISIDWHNPFRNLVAEEAAQELKAEVDESKAWLDHTIRDVFAMFAAPGVHAPAQIDVRLTPREYAFHGQPRLLKVALEKFVFSEIQEGNSHTYKLKEKVASVAHELGHVLFFETGAHRIEEMAIGVEINDKYRRQMQEYESLVDQIRPPVNFSKMSSQEREAFRSREKLLTPKIKSLQEPIKETRAQLNVLAPFHEMTGPYQELYADLIAYLYTGEDASLVNTIVYPGEELGPLEHRLFQGPPIPIDTWFFQDNYIALTPTRRWIQRNLIEQQALPKAEVARRVLHACLTEIHTRIHDADLSKVTPQLMNRRMIKALEEQ